MSEMIFLFLVVGVFAPLTIAAAAFGVSYYFDRATRRTDAQFDGGFDHDHRRTTRITSHVEMVKPEDLP